MIVEEGTEFAFTTLGDLCNLGGSESRMRLELWRLVCADSPNRSAEVMNVIDVNPAQRYACCKQFAISQEAGSCET